MSAVQISEEGKKDKILVFFFFNPIIPSPALSLHEWYYNDLNFG